MVSPYDIEEIFPDDPASVRLPPQQAGSTARNLAVTLVADYTLRTRAWLPSASIVALLEEAGVGSGAARTAISRLSRSQILESSRDGRYSFYRLTSAAAANLTGGGAWIARFGTRAEPWDRYWTLVSFSFPQDERGRRALAGSLGKTSSMSYGLTTELLRRRVGGDRRRVDDAAPILSIHSPAGCDRLTGSGEATEEHRLTVPWPTCTMIDTR